MEVPIKDITTINKIKEYYKRKNNYRDLLFFLLSINTGLKVNELLDLDVKDVKEQDFIVVEQCKDKRKKQIPLNHEIKKLIKRVIADKKETEPLFITVRGNRNTRNSVYCNFKDVCDNLGLHNVSASSLRKTFGYHYYKKNKDLVFLQWWFNQATISQTIKYLCIDNLEEDLNLRYDTEFCL